MTTSFRSWKPTQLEEMRVRLVIGNVRYDRRMQMAHLALSRTTWNCQKWDTALQHNAAITRNLIRTIPRPVVVTVHIEGRPAWALVDIFTIGLFYFI